MSKKEKLQYAMGELLLLLEDAQKRKIKLMETEETNTPENIRKIEILIRKIESQITAIKSIT